MFVIFLLHMLHCVHYFPSEEDEVESVVDTQCNFIAPNIIINK